MSKTSLVILVSLLLQAGTSFAQNFFVFIGADDRQPFYVRMNGAFHSSSAEGHLILSELKDSTYNITIGFPGQSRPEEHYAVSIHGKDQAFELRTQDPNELRLYDLQSNEWLTPQGGGVAGEARYAGVKKDDAFSRLMAGVVQDTAVLYNTYAMERALSDSPALARTSPALAATPAASQSPVPDTTTSAVAAIAGPETTVSIDSTSRAGAIPAHPTASVSTPPVAPAADTAAGSLASSMTHPPAARFNDSGTTGSLYRPVPKDSAAASIPTAIGAPLDRKVSPVTKLSERHTSKNVRLVYADHSGSKKADTIIVIIPVDSPATAKAADRPPHGVDSSHLPAARTPIPNADADSPTVSSGTANRATVSSTTTNEAARPHPVDSSHKPTKTIAFLNSDCHDFATDLDVDKLRVRLLQAGRDEDRISLARKTFRIKCFSTHQIRALSEVFASDAARFRFFEAAWPFAADEHFHELSDLLIDPVYIAKFKTMTHQQ